MLALVGLALLCACSDPVDAVREARISPDESVTVEQALKRYPYFKGVTWNTYEDKDGKRIVEADCDIDVAANCRGVNKAGLKLAQRDVTRNYVQARFIVEGFPRKVRAQEARHVTQCASGTRLGFADPKYLRAIYNREQVRFFCLDGLNCTGETGSSQPASGQQGAEPPAP
ncbi:MAG: hypothetical protein P4L39_04660 [Humidesulfovibrio sp.]|nr:hypothetical protein [Humidesulfovibrio sp.]